MAATPQYAGFFFRGESGKTYSIDAYVSDVNGGLVNFDAGAGAGASAPTYFIAPENMILTDFSMTTGTADTEKIRICKNGVSTPNVLRYVQHVSTNSDRPTLSIGFTQGTQITAFQISD
jgi:hypothetical protein